jgi:succinyl-diaminopimelate desuccinylase
VAKLVRAIISLRAAAAGDQGIMIETSTRQALLDLVESHRGEVIQLCSRLAATDSQNPLGDTTRIAEVCMDFLRGIPGVETRAVIGRAPIANVLARLKGQRPGRRLVFNGHLDTGMVPDPERWTVPPFGGTVRNDRIYGRGVADMKAGLAAQMGGLAVLAEIRSELAGEVVLTLVADEGSGAQWGTLFLLDQCPEAHGEAMISGDVGSPLVAHFGEKGFLWLDIVAEGQSAGAHISRAQCGQPADEGAQSRSSA